MMAVTTHTERTDSAEAGRLAELYARHSPAAGRLAYLLTGDADLAEDLTQEAFVRAFGRFRDLRRPESFEWYLRRTLQQLSPRQRTAIVLRFYEDLSDVQVADTMRCPVGTAKSLIHRGLERLRSEVTEA